jgi:uncharacterized membrane protein YfcA
MVALVSFLLCSYFVYELTNAWTISWIRFIVTGLAGIAGALLGYLVFAYILVVLIGLSIIVLVVYVRYILFFDSNQTEKSPKIINKSKDKEIR